ncbi:hypothetical protein O181_121837, partial [Austropuccinia psidii MF-1]|nr:hypothetical protein [Austropuccinia psidii MF-1]
IVDLPNITVVHILLFILKPLAAHRLVSHSIRFTVLTLDPLQTTVDTKDKNLKK